MATSLTARNQTQKISGFINNTVNVQFGDNVAPISQIIYTIPIGKTYKIHVYVDGVQFTKTGTDTFLPPNIQIQLDGKTIREFVYDPTGTKYGTIIDDNNVTFQSLEYTLKSGQIITATTSNTGRAVGQKCNVTVTVTQEGIS